MLFLLTPLLVKIFTYFIKHHDLVEETFPNSRRRAECLRLPSTFSKEIKGGSKEIARTGRIFSCHQRRGARFLINVRARREMAPPSTAVSLRLRTISTLSFQERITYRKSMKSSTPDGRPCYWRFLTFVAHNRWYIGGVMQTADRQSCLADHAALAGPFTLTWTRRKE